MFNFSHTRVVKNNTSRKHLTFVFHCKKNEVLYTRATKEQNRNNITFYLIDNLKYKLRM